MKDMEEHKVKYAEEARKKYGDTDSYKESMEKTSTYTKEDWKKIKEVGEEINRRIIENMDKGPADPEVQKGVGEFRQYISDHFYSCTPEIFRSLSELYVSDGSFTNNMDKDKPGYTAFLRDAIHIYCDNKK